MIPVKLKDTVNLVPKKPIDVLLSFPGYWVTMMVGDGVGVVEMRRGRVRKWGASRSYLMKKKMIEINSTTLEKVFEKVIKLVKSDEYLANVNFVDLRKFIADSFGYPVNLERIGREAIGSVDLLDKMNELSNKLLAGGKKDEIEETYKEVF